MNSEARKLSLKCHFKFCPLFLPDKSEFCLEALSVVLSCNCLPFCFSSLSCHAITGSNEATGEKWTRVDGVRGLPGETQKTEVVVLFPFLGNYIPDPLWNVTYLPNRNWGAQPQPKLSTFKMEPTLVHELIQGCWLPPTSSWTEPMAGYNNYQNIHAAYVPHNADGDRGNNGLSSAPFGHWISLLLYSAPRNPDLHWRQSCSESQHVLEAVRVCKTSWVTRARLFPHTLPRRAQAQPGKQNRSCLAGSLTSHCQSDKALCHWKHFVGKSWVYWVDMTQATLFSIEKTATGNWAENYTEL